MVGIYILLSIGPLRFGIWRRSRISVPLQYRYLPHDNLTLEDLEQIYSVRRCYFVIVLLQIHGTNSTARIVTILPRLCSIFSFVLFFSVTVKGRHLAPASSTGHRHACLRSCGKDNCNNILLARSRPNALGAGPQPASSIPYHLICKIVQMQQ